MTGRLENVSVGSALPREDWNTPRKVVDRLPDALGGPVDFDPCSNPSSIVEARARVWLPSYFDALGIAPDALHHLGVFAGDGLALDWPGRSFQNPPYTRQDNPIWAIKISAQGTRAREREHSSIALVPSAPGCKWFRPYRPRAHGGQSDGVILGGRLQFGGAKHKAPFESALVYFGRDPDRFFRAFAAFGWGIR